MIKKNLLYNSLLSISQVLFPLIIFPYTLKILEPAGTGLVNFADSLTQYLLSIAAVGIPVYGVMQISKSRHDQDKMSKVFTELISVHFSITLLLLTGYLSMIFTLKKFSDNQYLYFISCATLLTNIFTVEWFFQGIERFRYITLRTILIRVLSVILIFTLVKKKEDLLLYYGILFVTNFLNAVVNFLYAIRLVQFRYTGLNIKQHIRPLVYIFFSYVAISMYIMLDTVLLGFLSNDSAVGYYSTAIKVCKIPLAFVTALSTVMIPRISASYSTGKHDYVKNLVQKSFAYIIGLSIPIGVGLFLLAPDIIALLADEKFQPSVIAIRIMAPLTLLIGLSNIFGVQMLTSMGKEKITLYAVVSGMCISITFNLLLIPKYSYLATAFTSLFTECLVTIITGWYALRFFKVKLPYQIIWQSILSCLLFYPIIYFIEYLFSNSLIRIILSVGSASIIYFLINFYLFKNIFVRQSIQGLLSKIGYGKI